GDEPKRIQEELRWLAGVLVEARNLDVLLMKAKDSDLRAKLKDALNKACSSSIAEMNFRCRRVPRLSSNRDPKNSDA
ncbi:hypothetical protein ACC775_38390, partial [Rhizobium ruizarguesonis]